MTMISLHGFVMSQIVLISALQFIFQWRAEEGWEGLGYSAKALGDPFSPMELSGAHQPCGDTPSAMCSTWILHFSAVVKVKQYSTLFNHIQKQLFKQLNTPKAYGASWV